MLTFPASVREKDSYITKQISIETLTNFLERDYDKVATEPFMIYLRDLEINLKDLILTWTRFKTSYIPRKFNIFLTIKKAVKYLTHTYIYLQLQLRAYHHWE